MRNDDLLDKRMTYHEFCDYLSSAWLAAEETTKIYPDRKFRLAFLSDLERRIAYAGLQGSRYTSPHS